MELTDIRFALLTAAGVSDKALKYLSEPDRDEAIRALIDNFLEPAGEDFVDELVYRYLITSGDSVGGALRNIWGALAKRKVTRSLIAHLEIKALPIQWYHNDAKKWIATSPSDTDIELHLKHLSWSSNKGERVLHYDRKPKFINKSVDLCLLNSGTTDAEDRFKEPNAYLAAGELKGGIDPAGADEHWKTARTALQRIRDAFQVHPPDTFFIGAAIESHMASELWKDLEEGKLSNAANLNRPDQLSSLCGWLSSL